jgi:hypothetical protein
VLSRLDGEHRWTIKDLIHYAVTEESEKKYGKSTKKRARDISTMIALEGHPSLLRARSAADFFEGHQRLPFNWPPQFGPKYGKIYLLAGIGGQLLH